MLAKYFPVNVWSVVSTLTSLLGLASEPLYCEVCCNVFFITKTTFWKINCIANWILRDNYIVMVFMVRIIRIWSSQVPKTLVLQVSDFLLYSGNVDNHVDSPPYWLIFLSLTFSAGISKISFLKLDACNLGFWGNFDV